MARKINKKVSRKASRKMHKPMRKMWAPSGAVRQSGWMSDKWNMASQKASEYGTMASQKASEYGSMASQKAKDMYNKYMNKEEAPMAESEPVSMEKPKRKRRTMKRTMKKKSQKRSKKMSAIFDKEDIIPTAAGAGAGAILGGGRGALAGGLIGYGASKLLRRRKD